MSAREALQGAMVTAVSGAVAVPVFDAPPVRGARPYVLVEEPVLTDWSTKDWRGCEARLAVIVRDGGERPVRVRALLAQASDAVLAMPVALEDWRVVTLRPVRERLVRSRDEWVGTAEFVVRMRED